MNTKSEAISDSILIESEDSVGFRMLDKHSSVRSLPFVFSEIVMRNRALKLLSKPLERDLLVKNSARELGMLVCKTFSEQTKRVVNSRKQGVLC